jgi:hypothetical protein
VQPNNAMVFIVPGSSHEPCRIGSVDESDRAVVLKEKVVSDLTDGWSSWVSVPPYGEEQLVLGRCQTSGACLLLTPALEMPQAGSKRKQSSVGGLR